MVREYELIHEQQFEVHYKRWVSVKSRTIYLGVEVFLHRPTSRESQYWVITHLQTGKSLYRGKVSPYPAGMVRALDQNLTPEQREKLRILSGRRLYLAQAYAQLCGLPGVREARPLIQAKQEEIRRLESIITGQDLPW